MPKKPSIPPAERDATHAAARNTDSGPAQPAPPAAGKGDLPTQKAIDTQAMASAMPSNPNKPSEYGEVNALDTPKGATVEAPSRLPTASTLSEKNFLRQGRHRSA